jgi:hypothetical protein
MSFIGGTSTQTLLASTVANSENMMVFASLATTVSGSAVKLDGVLEALFTLQ